MAAIENIIMEDGHYLKVLNNINEYLMKDGKTRYSVFYFNRRGADYLVASSGVLDDGRSDKLVRIDLYRKKGSLLGYWLLDTDVLMEDLEKIGVLLMDKLFFDEWEHDYSFNQNRGCEYFPCHKVRDENTFSCLFCYCPLYLIPDCGGNFSLLFNGMKDCSDCLLPHKKECYGYIVDKLSKKISG